MSTEERAAKSSAHREFQRQEIAARELQLAADDRKEAKRVGRPSMYSLEIAERICAVLSQGKSLKTACKGEGMPSVETVIGWWNKYPEFLQLYTRAKEEGADNLVDEMLDISDDGSNDWMEDNAPHSPGWKVNGEHINRSRLRVETRKWIASKLKPKRYGERIQTEVTGKDGGPIAIDITEQARLIAFVLASASKPELLPSVDTPALEHDSGESILSKDVTTQDTVLIDQSLTESQDGDT